MDQEQRNRESAREHRRTVHVHPVSLRQRGDIHRVPHGLRDENERAVAVHVAIEKENYRNYIGEGDEVYIHQRSHVSRRCSDREKDGGGVLLVMLSLAIKKNTGSGMDVNGRNWCVESLKQ